MHDFYVAMLTELTQKLVNYQRSYEDALQRYQRMLQPPDPEDLAVAEANLAFARGQLAQAKLEVERLKDGTSPAALAVLQAQLEDAQRQAERLKDGPDPSEVAAAKARLTAVQASLELSRQTAPFHGVITEVSIQPGDLVSPGSPAFGLDDLSSLQVELQTSEVDINRVQTGQSVTLKLDAVPGREYHGQVVEIPAVGNDANGVATFTLKAEIEDADLSIRPAMTVKATIVVAELRDVVLVPASAVRILDGQQVVYILREGQPEPVSVTLGSSSADETQVLEGNLQAEDEVVLNPEG
jgi:HlyD family secretion protein